MQLRAFHIASLCKSTTLVLNYDDEPLPSGALLLLAESTLTETKMTSRGSQSRPITPQPQSMRILQDRHPSRNLHPAGAQHVVYASAVTNHGMFVRPGLSKSEPSGSRTDLNGGIKDTLMSRRATVDWFNIFCDAFIRPSCQRKASYQLITSTFHKP